MIIELLAHLISTDSKGVNKMKIAIDMTDDDLHELLSGEEFDWSYESDTGETVEVHLFNADLMNDE